MKKTIKKFAFILLGLMVISSGANAQVLKKIGEKAKEATNQTINRGSQQEQKVGTSQSTQQEQKTPNTVSSTQVGKTFPAEKHSMCLSIMEAIATMVQRQLL